jgi:serine/threonine-protein kinase
MGIVFSAMHLQLDQRIAIKFMSSVPMVGDNGLERFMREAQHAAGIRSEHVARVFDVASLEDGTPYIVMEHLDGEDLAQLITRRGSLPPEEAADYVLQAGEAIAEAHLAGIVHRDLKPGNLFCCHRDGGAPLVKVLDFGVSKLLPGAERPARRYTPTPPRVVIGSPNYAAPEQLRAPSAVDTRADVWALGAILYRLVSGQLPFMGNSLVEIYTNVLNRSLRPLSLVRPDISREFGEVVARALAKDPNARFQTVRDLAQALAPFVQPRSLASIARIENLYRGRSKPGFSDGVPTASAVLDATDEKTAATKIERPVVLRASPVGRPRTLTAVVSAAGAVGAVAFFIAALKLAGGAEPASEARARGVASGAVGAPPSVPSPKTLSLPETATGAPPAAPPEVARSLSLFRSPPPPPSAQTPSLSARRSPDTSGFGGLQ